jgi:TPR repeat protein
VVQLLDRGCDGGDATACAAVAELHRQGRGTPRNLARALTQYNRACEAKVTAACVEAGHLYDSIGRRELAQKRYATACEHGDRRGCRFVR